ncbi:MAG: HAD family hydrolase [Alphaproteobacteria bacterium]
MSPPVRIGLDLDGTVLDSRRRHVVAVVRAAGEEGVSLSEAMAERYFALKCDGATGLEALRRLEVASAEGICRRWLERIETREMLALDHPYPGVAEVLATAHGAGMRFVLVTARRDAAAVREQLVQHDLARFFDDIRVIDPFQDLIPADTRFDSSAGIEPPLRRQPSGRTPAPGEGRQKDTRRSFQGPPGMAGGGKARACADLVLSAVIGDTEVDLAWAQGMGVPFLGVGWGFRSPEFWAGRGVTVFPGLREAIDEVGEVGEVG